jgi:calcineurin-like phosphoesterase family protein
MIYFTSDMHFDHENIIELSARPFNNIEEMNEELIRRHNSIVKPEDTVYDLGDFCFSRKASYFLHRLNGNRVRLNGNHDYDLSGPYMMVIKPDTLKDEFGRHIPITLCHFAMRSWFNSHYGSWHLFGHHHGLFEPHGMSFDVGVDNWDYYPISLDEVTEKMKTLKPIVDFRKQKRIDHEMRKEKK